MRAVLVQNMRQKYVEFGEICAKICRVYGAYMLHVCGITEICGVNDACACLRCTKCAEMLKNAITYVEIWDYMRTFANLCINRHSKCINKYSKF